MSKGAAGWLGVRILLAGLLVLGVSCGGSGGGGGGGGQSAGLLWNSQSGSAGGTPGTGSTGSTLWVDPNSGLGAVPAPPDPEDIRTYTRPDIYILGNQHPLLTDVLGHNHTTLLAQEDRAADLLNTFRYNEYIRLLGFPAPPNALLSDHTTLRQSARAHAKHYAIWHPNVPLPLKNAEGDDLLAVDAHHVGIGRLAKCKLKADLAKQLVASGLPFRTGDDAANYWIMNSPDLIRGVDWTHMSVGFWTGGGQGYYWNAIFAKNPAPDVTLPTDPIHLF